MAARLARTKAGRRERAARQRRLEEQRDAVRVAQRAETALAKEKARAEAARRRAHEDAERQALAATAVRAYEHYRCVRSWAQRMRGTEGEVSRTSAEARIETELAHLWDASPETIASLRRWCEPLSGVRALDYDPVPDGLVQQLRGELAMLWKQVGRELFVPEAAILGGFGHSKKGDLYNADTLAFFKVLVAMQDGAILPVYRGATRRLVWELGGGWGGFARHFRTVCPNVTYLITSSPARFLVLAVYLMTAFPGARCRFYDPDSPSDVWRDWEQVDFVFVPDGALPLVQPPRLDLVVDLLTLCRMQPDRASAHIERAFELGCPFTYSLLPAGGSSEASSTALQAVSRFYWPHTIPPRREQTRSGSMTAEPDPDLDREPSSLVGWRRIRA